MLTSSDILQLNKQLDNPLIENWDPNQTEHIEGAAYDVRVETVERVRHPKNAHTPFLGTTHRYGLNTIEIEPLGNIRNSYDDPTPFIGWILHPFRWYWLTTVEQVNVPDNLRLGIVRRLSWTEMGAIFQASAVPPGYHGSLRFSIYLAVDCPVILEQYARIASLEFMQLTGPENALYAGPRQGGKPLYEDNKIEKGF